MIISIIIAKMAEKVLKICKRGATTLPGRIATAGQVHRNYIRLIFLDDLKPWL